MSPEMQGLKDKVSTLTTVKDSLLAYLAGLADQLKTAADDKAAVLDIANEIASDSDAITAAITANTPTP